MKWEFLGKQELRDSDIPGKGYTYAPALWRTPVPGGWLLMTLNSKSNDPQPMLSFYPDADHLWTGKNPPEAGYLLRPASADSAPSTEHLLRPAYEENPESKRLEGE
jgi:hypothetical protein